MSIVGDDRHRTPPAFRAIHAMITTSTGTLGAAARILAAPQISKIEDTAHGIYRLPEPLVHIMIVRIKAATSTVGKSICRPSAIARDGASFSLGSRVTGILALSVFDTTRNVLPHPYSRATQLSILRDRRYSARPGTWPGPGLVEERATRPAAPASCPSVRRMLIRLTAKSMSSSPGNCLARQMRHNPLPGLSRSEDQVERGQGCRGSQPGWASWQGDRTNPNCVSRSSRCGFCRRLAGLSNTKTEPDPPRFTYTPRIGSMQLHYGTPPGTATTGMSCPDEGIDACNINRLWKKHLNSGPVNPAGRLSWSVTRVASSRREH